MTAGRRLHIYPRQWEPEPGYLGSLYSNCCGNTAGRLCGIGIYRGIMKPRIVIIMQRYSRRF